MQQRQDLILSQCSVLFHHAGLMDHAHVGIAGEGGGATAIMTKAKGNSQEQAVVHAVCTLSSLLLTLVVEPLSLSSLSILSCMRLCKKEGPRLLQNRKVIELSKFVSFFFKEEYQNGVGSRMKLGQMQREKAAMLKNAQSTNWDDALYFTTSEYIIVQTYSNVSSSIHFPVIHF